MGDILLTTSDLFFNLMFFLILARVILSWLPQYRYSQIGELVFNITEPIVGPIQRRMPAMGMFDFSPIIAWVLLIVAQTIVDTAIRAAFNLP